MPYRSKEGLLFHYIDKINTEINEADYKTSLTGRLGPLFGHFAGTRLTAKLHDDPVLSASYLPEDDGTLIALKRKDGQWDLIAQTTLISDNGSYNRPSTSIRIFDKVASYLTTAEADARIKAAHAVTAKKNKNKPSCG